MNPHKRIKLIFLCTLACTLTVLAVVGASVIYSHYNSPKPTEVYQSGSVSFQWQPERGTTDTFNCFCAEHGNYVGHIVVTDRGFVNTYIGTEEKGSYRDKESAVKYIERLATDAKDCDK